MDAQLDLPDGAAAPPVIWTLGERIVGPDAWAVAKPLLPSIYVPEFAPFPIPPPGPIPDLSPAQSVEWLRRLYSSYRSAKAGKVVSIYGRGLPPRARTLLETAAAFFNGTARPKIDEFYPDGRRKVPEKLAPAAWIAFQAQRYAKRTFTPALESIFAPLNFQDKKLVNIFTHTKWADPPSLALPDSPELSVFYGRLQEMVEVAGFSTIEELDNLTAAWCAAYRSALERACTQKQEWSQSFDALIKEGRWVWG